MFPQHSDHPLHAVRQILAAVAHQEIAPVKPAVLHSQLPKVPPLQVRHHQRPGQQRDPKPRPGAGQQGSGADALHYRLRRGARSLQAGIHTVPGAAAPLPQQQPLFRQLRQSQGASEKFHGAVIDHYGKDDTRVFREVTEVGEALEQIQETVGTNMKSQAAVLYDRENDWAIADVQGPRNEDMHYRENVQKNYRALREQGLNIDIIAMEHDLADYKVLAAPMAYMFKDGYEEKLRTYVENGGTLVLSYWSGLVDGTDRCFLGGTPYGLMDAAGIRSTEIDALYDWEENHAIPEAGSHLGISNVYTCKNLCELVKVSDAEVLMRYGEDFYQGYPVLTHKAFGKGRVYYVCADMELGFYQDFYGRVAAEAGLKSPIEIIPEGVSVTVRENEDTEYLFIQNYARKPQAVPVPAEYELLYGTESEVMAPLQTRILKKHK